MSRCPVGWTGYRCEIAASVDSSASSGSKSHSSETPVSKTLRFGPICSLYLPSCRYCLYCHTSTSTAAAGTSCGWCHLVVQAENAWVSPGSDTSDPISHFLCSSHLCYLASLSFLPFDNHLYFLSPRSLWPGKSRSQCSR